ncbi:MAG TPA: hypothetical protein VMT85_19335 [Thermoanaerobaculia bacterium]|nr:hypothetical protein [Thermoanaerobaculia bacterium]
MSGDGDLQVRKLREELEDALEETRTAIREDTGRIARRAWTVPLIAAGIGFVAALGLKLRSRRRLRD